MLTRRQELAETKAAHNHPTYSRMSFVMGCGVQGAGSGSHVLDDHGDAFLAMFDQYGNQSFGYSHDRILSAIRDQLDTGVLNSTKIMFEEVQVQLCARLAELTGQRLPFAYLANGGGETIDNALKLARAATGRRKFVTAVDCFHGKTFGALSAAGRPEHLALYHPLLEHFHQVPFDDLDALAEVLDEDTAAVLLAPVQAEGGVIVGAPDYLREVRRMCTEAGALLILDEMQTAFGRCGTFFAFEHFDAVPDLLCIGKAFGGGVVPLSAVLGTERVWASLAALPSTFGSSLGGNPLSCRVGLEVIEIASQEPFLAAVRQKGELIGTRLADLADRFPELIRSHRGLGKMNGLEFRDETLGGLVLHLLLRRGVTSTYSLYNNRVLRIQPPMVISAADLRTGLDAVADALAAVENYRAIHGGAAVTLSPITVTVHTGQDSAELVRLLHRRPYLFDPFALDTTAQPSADRENRFRGTLGDDVVHWTDRVERTTDGVRLRADPDWLWRKLDRTVTVRPARTDGGTGGAASTDNTDSTDSTDSTAGGSVVAIRIAWDAGTGPYEAMLAGPIGYHIRSRLAVLTGQDAARPHRLAEV